MKVTGLPIAIRAPGTIPRCLLKRPSRLHHYQDRPEYLEESWRLEQICCHSHLREKPLANPCMKNSQMSKIINPKSMVRNRMANADYVAIEMVIYECSKLEQKEYQTRHPWVGMMIHWELCKKSKFDHTNKWVCTNQCHSWRMRRIQFAEILRYKLTTEFRPENPTYW